MSPWEDSCIFVIVIVNQLIIWGVMWLTLRVRKLLKIWEIQKKKGKGTKGGKGGKSGTGGRGRKGKLWEGGLEGEEEEGSEESVNNNEEGLLK